jgi:thiol-disulfide isomerase/thioredoxin
MEKQKTYRILGAVALLMTVAAASIALTSNPDTPSQVSGDWKEVELTDVNSGESYTVADLEKPVLVENFAVWCPTCTRQQVEIREMLEDSDVDVRVVSLDTDPNEDAEKIRQHTSRNDFDWRYSVAPPQLTQSLRQEFGASILNPPLAPKILVCGNATRKLDFGVKTSNKLAEEIKRGC